MKLSVIIPAKNEQGCIESTLATVCQTLITAAIPYEIVVVDDGSTDATRECVRRAALAHEGIVLVENMGRHGFGMAVRAGVARATGDAIAIMMADASDSPDDLVGYYRTLLEG